jgi:hypothetical protein
VAAAGLDEEVEEGLDCIVVGINMDVVEGIVDVEKVVGDGVVWDEEVLSCAEEVAGRTSAKKRSAVDRRK